MQLLSRAFAGMPSLFMDPHTSQCSPYLSVPTLMACAYPVWFCPPYLSALRPCLAPGAQGSGLWASPGERATGCAPLAGLADGAGADGCPGGH
eukprot:scaffold64088_cov23-Tisochrysis_lutea.AAC.1